MRNAAIAFFILFPFLNVFGQQSVNFGLIYGKRTTYNDYSYSNSVFGVSAEYNKHLSNTFDLRIGAGIETTDPGTFYARGNTFSYDNFYVIPVRIGLQKNFLEDKIFVFAEPGIGIGFFPYEWDNTTSTNINISYALGGGYRYYLNDRRYLQASLSYNRNPYDNIIKFSWVALRVAYGFKWQNE